jgi:RNA 2',3'-cyclic 3'-phosphodiesterase
VSAEQARLFTALELSEKAISALVRWGDERRSEVGGRGSGDHGLRRLEASALHVTLCFLGSQRVHDIVAIAAACRSVEGNGAIDLQLGEPLWLPDRRPRVLAVTLEDRSGALAALQDALADRLEQGGWYEPERRPFLAHVTVGRFGRSGGRPQEIEAPDPVRFRATTVTLQRSRAGPGGSRYERLVEVALAPA